MTDARAAEPTLSQAANIWPTEIRVHEKGRRLAVSFEDGARFDLSAEYLRVMSPSAEVQGHNRRERKIVGGKRDVAILAVDPIGTYAVKLTFDDLHSTGIYTWAYLHELGCAEPAKWQAYLSALEAKGLSRDRGGEARAE